MHDSVTHPYHPLSVVGHWLSALLALACMLAILLASFAGRGHPAYSLLMGLHLWSGQGLFLVNLLRLLALSAFGTPAPAACDDAQRLVARVLHGLLYALIGFLACSGGLLMLAHAAGQQWLGMSIPLLLTGGAVLMVGQVHQLAGMALVFVCLAHVLFSLALQLVSEQRPLQRMAPEGDLLDYLAAPQDSKGYARLDIADNKSLGNT
ncbi:cytochrome b/b6 domain-containing protein [Chitinilyticum piscinae]|uniref:Cytochrome b/b6 domain-containing protein n=1 Tax=Chitinilyticum piscinae TaxID=2866724 RepID=A0A8J7FJ55_9NEIS|nr:cytochrome b/b6 domain-containing protein [Chitinilyticum piscinae]MBE9610300.1 cytochrome b/b6 domain-containing protein [Chitinilyticum piscinae]